MSLLDGILQNIGGAPDNVANLAEQVGLDPDIVENAIKALGRSHPAEGDTVELASTETGLDSNILNTILEKIGGEGSLGGFASMLDLDGDGNPLDDIAGMAGKLFGRD